MSSPFNVKNYYRFFNSIYPNHTISAGVYYKVYAPINMTIQETYTSTENWQLFYQAGIFFIRNYQSGADLQLGLTADDLTTPRLLRTSGALGQQWKITLRSDSTYRITNGLVSNASSLGIAPAGATVPAMDSDDNNGHWNISINQSAGTILDPAMLAPVKNIVVSFFFPYFFFSTRVHWGKSTSDILLGIFYYLISRRNRWHRRRCPRFCDNHHRSGIIPHEKAEAEEPQGLSGSQWRDGTAKPFAYENEKRITYAAPPVEMSAERQIVRTDLGYE